MKPKRFPAARHRPADRDMPRRLFSAGLTSLPMRPAAASWQLAGHTLLQPHLRGALGGKRGR